MSTSGFEFRQLPLSDRIQLVEEIWDSIAEDTSCQPQISTAEMTELHRRLDSHRENPSTSVPWEEVRVALNPDVP